jgi:hypothetical protein
MMDGRHSPNASIFGLALITAGGEQLQGWLIMVGCRSRLCWHLSRTYLSFALGKIGSRKRWRTRLSTSGCRLGTMNFTTKRPWLHGVKKRQSADLKRKRRLPKYWNAEREGTWNRQVTRGFSSNSADMRTIYGTVDRLPRVSISNHGNTDVTSQDKRVVSIYQTN